MGDASQGGGEAEFVSLLLFLYLFHFLENREGQFTNTSPNSVNWYQRNYPYAWVGARLVRDVE